MKFEVGSEVEYGAGDSVIGYHTGRVTKVDSRGLVTIERDDGEIIEFTKRTGDEFHLRGTALYHEVTRLRLVASWSAYPRIVVYHYEDEDHYVAVLDLSGDDHPVSRGPSGLAATTPEAAVKALHDAVAQSYAHRVAGRRTPYAVRWHEALQAHPPIVKGAIWRTSWREQS